MNLNCQHFDGLTGERGTITAETTLRPRGKAERRALALHRHSRPWHPMPCSRPPGGGAWRRWAFASRGGGDDAPHQLGHALVVHPGLLFCAAMPVAQRVEVEVVEVIVEREQILR